MKIYALIDGNNLVCGIVQTEEDENLLALTRAFPQVIDITNYQPMPQIGWSFDGQQVVGTASSKKITKLAMNQRFTVSEMLGLLTYVNSNPASIVSLLMQRLQMATFVDLARPDTQAGVYLLASAPFNLITMARANEILTTPPAPAEVYQP